MIEQDNNIYRIVYRNYERVVNGDSNRLKLSSASRSNIAINLSKTEKANNVETSETPKVTVYDNTTSRGSNNMEYVLLSPERVPVSARLVASKAVKTKKGDNIRENAKERTVGTSRSNYSADVTVSKNDDSYTVSVKNSDNVGYKFNSGHNIAKQLEHFEEKKNEPIKSETIPQEDNKAWVDINFDKASVDVDNNKVENNIPEIKHEVPKNVPEYGTSSSDIFGGTISKDETLSSYTEKKAESKSVVGTNDLISSIPNPIENHENKAEVREEKEDQLTDVHNKLFGIGHEVSHVADINKMSPEALKRYAAEVKSIKEKTNSIEEENKKLEDENKKSLEETMDLRNVYDELAARVFANINQQKENNLKAQEIANERHNKLVNEGKEIESNRLNEQAQLDEINKILNEFGGEYTSSNNARTR